MVWSAGKGGGAHQTQSLLRLLLMMRKTRLVGYDLDALIFDLILIVDALILDLILIVQ